METVEVLEMLFDDVLKAWEFNEKSYPAIPPPELASERKLFVLRHLSYHLMKEVGKLARALERYDHSDGRVDFVDHEIVRDLFVATLRLATEGMSSQALLDQFEGYLKHRKELRQPKP